MTKIGKRLVEDFIVPALDNKTYGDYLKWIDKEKKIFSLKWSHKNAAKWDDTETIVFQEWDRLKEHYKPEEKNYHMQAKQRFRAALYKLNSVRRIECKEKNVKKYQLIDGNRKKMNDSSKPKTPSPKKNVADNHVSVIRKHTSSIKTSDIMKDSSKWRRTNPDSSGYASSSSSAANFDKSDSSDHMELQHMELQSCIHDYKIGQKKQNEMILSNSFKCMHISPPKEEENSLPEINEDYVRGISCASKTPNVPSQQVSLYNGGISQRFESPAIILVQTYNEYPDYVEYKNGYTDDGIISDDSDCVLNLSVKSDDSEVLFR